MSDHALSDHALSDDAMIWRPCEAPDRPLGWGAVFCDCETCALALAGLAADQPDRLLGVKFGNARRLVVAAAVLVAGGVRGNAIADRFGEGDDWVRELWVADDSGRHPEGMSPGEAGILALISEEGLPVPEWNVEVDAATGARRPAEVRRLTR